MAGDVENFYPFEGKLTEIRCLLSGHLQTEPLLGNGFAIFQTGVAHIARGNAGKFCQLLAYKQGVAIGFAHFYGNKFAIATHVVAELFFHHKICTFRF